jgi:hypothetical protein
LSYKDKVIVFGGCYMYNKKRRSRECINQVMVFDPFENSLKAIKTGGISITPRRAHCAAIFSKLGFLTLGREAYDSLWRLH